MTDEEIKIWITTNHPNYLVSIKDLIIDICDYKYFQNGTSSEILKYCNNIDKINILKEISAMDLDKHKWWIVFKIISQCLDDLQIDNTSLKSFLKFAYLIIKEDLYNGILHGSLEKYSHKNPDKAKDIISIMVSSEEEFSYFFIPPFIIGITLCSYDDGINIALKLLESSNEKIICSGLNTLSLIKYNDTSVLNSVALKVSQLLKTGISNCTFGAVEEFFCSIWIYDNDYISNIKELQKLRIPEIDYQVSLFLSRKFNEIITSESVFLEVLINLSETDYQFKGKFKI
jgi:hypothetical protein